MALETLLKYAHDYVMLGRKTNPALLPDEFFKVSTATFDLCHLSSLSLGKHCDKLDKFQATIPLTTLLVLK